MVRIDHIALPSRDAERAATRLAALLGLAPPTPDGADGDIFRVTLGDGACVLFQPAETIDAVHVAFRVDAGVFASVVARLRADAIAHGNDPEDRDNGRTDDVLGGAGRVCFVDDDGHLFEVCC